MIFTLNIRTALIANLTASALFERVTPFSTSDLSAALTALRDAPSSIAIIVPGDDKFEHEFIPGTNTPVRTEIKNNFELLVSARQLDMRGTADVDGEALNFKDHILARLLWDDLGVPDLICMPTLCEPVIIASEQEGQTKGREAWKITLEIRQQIYG